MRLPVEKELRKLSGIQMLFTMTGKIGRAWLHFIHHNVSMVCRYNSLLVNHGQSEQLISQNYNKKKNILTLKMSIV